MAVDDAHHRYHGEAPQHLPRLDKVQLSISPRVLKSAPCTRHPSWHAGTLSAFGIKGEDIVKSLVALVSLALLGCAAIWAQNAGSKVKNADKPAGTQKPAGG